MVCLIFFDFISKSEYILSYRTLNYLLFQVVFSDSNYNPDTADARYAFKGVHKWFALSFMTPSGYDDPWV